MSRWLARLQREEKNAKSPSDTTDKTDKTPVEPVSSVLSVCQRGECEKISEDRLTVAAANPSTAGSDHSPAPMPIAFAKAPLHHVTFIPRAGPGVTIREPATEVSPREYDKHLDELIAAAGCGTNEAGRLADVKRRGSVVPRGERMIFTRGRA